MQGGRGNDKYDGLEGDDTILDVNYPEVNSGDDIMSGSTGDDFLISNGGADTIHGGLGNDIIHANSVPVSRDFSHDLVDCGSANDYAWIYSSEDTARLNCEFISDFDG